jgi:hypothetical protein
MLWAAVLLAAAGKEGVSAQGLPQKQPKFLTIICEQVKIGQASDHTRWEAGYPAAFEKAKATDYYLAMTSLTGPSQAWYIIPSDSYAAIGDRLKRQDKDPVLSAELNRLDKGDAQYVNNVQTIVALARPELSVGAFPDLAKARFYEMAIFDVRIGREQDFEQMAKAYAAAAQRAAPKTSYRMYEVQAGRHLPSFIFMTSLESYGELDQKLIDSQETFKQATADEMTVLKKFGDVTERVEDIHFQIDPVQSYVPKETRQKDPEFWMPK